MTKRASPLRQDTSRIIVPKSKARNTADGVLPVVGVVALLAAGGVAYGLAGGDTLSVGSSADTAKFARLIESEPAPTPPTFGTQTGGALRSDDFATGSVGQQWIVSDAASVHVASDGHNASLMLSAKGGEHQLWHERKDVVHVSQATADTNFSVKARFRSTPRERFQMQGFLIEGEDGDWVRVDLHSNGRALKVFAAATVDGRSEAILNEAVTDASELALDRVGDEWTVAYAADGAPLTRVGAFKFRTRVTSVGLFAGTSGEAQGFVAEVVEFQSAGDPLPSSDNRSERLLAQDSGPRRVAEAVASADAGAKVIAASEFDGEALEGWQVSAADGARVSLGRSDGDGVLMVETMGGPFDLWNGVRSAPRLTQKVADGPFAVSAKFLSIPTERYQMQGFVFEGEGTDLIRVNTHSDGETVTLFAAATDDGPDAKSERLFAETVTAEDVAYLSVARAEDDVYTLSRSADGRAWIEAGRFTRTMPVARVGLFAGHTADADGYTMIVDWFRPTADGSQPPDANEELAASETIVSD